MRRIETWKLQREIKRLGLQLQGCMEMFYGPFVQWKYDKYRSENVKIEAGEAAITGKIAVFLTFQPNGFAPSVIRTCAHLVAKGYAPLVVCNAPLTDQDRNALRPVAWKIAERPNFGYDFGGYRDGIWILDEQGITPDVLLILNDSVWFPVQKDEGLLAQMEASKADFLGAQVFGKFNNPQVTRKWRQPFFGSYFLMVKKAGILSSNFQKYWKNYRLTSNKESTLHRGERAFSYTMFEAGIEYEGIYSRDAFEAVTDDLSRAEIEIALEYLICIDPDLEHRRQALLSVENPDEAWESRAQVLIFDASESKNYIGSSPVVSFKKLRFPMIKKNNEMLYSRSRRAMVQALDKGIIQGLDPMIEAEIRTKVATQKF